MNTLLIVILAQIFLVFFHLYQSALQMQHSYLKQKKESLCSEYLEKKNSLLLYLESLKKCSSLKEYATQRGMISQRLKSVKHIKEVLEYGQQPQHTS